MSGWLHTEVVWRPPALMAHSSGTENKYRKYTVSYRIVPAKGLRSSAARK